MKRGLCLDWMNASSEFWRVRETEREQAFVMHCEKKGCFHNAQRDPFSSPTAAGHIRLSAHKELMAGAIEMPAKVT